MADVILQLVDRTALRNLHSMPLGELLDGMDSQSLRDLRPSVDPRFHRPFDVDLEGDILEWFDANEEIEHSENCLLYTSPSPRDATLSRMPSSA